MDGVLRNLPEAMNDDDAIEHIWTQPFNALPWVEGLPPLTKKQAEQGRANALNCLLLWLQETRALPPERIQRHLATLVWEPAARRSKSEAQRLRALMSAKDRSALGIAYGSLEKRVSENRQQAVAAREGEEQANARASDLEKALAETNDALKDKTEALTGVRKEFETEKARHSADLAHARSELEDLRGRVVRKMREEVSLLDEGLRALRRDPPRIHVMEDHAERAIDGLKRGIEEIKGGGGQ
jgi:chromosome segregation ATPase